MKPMTIFVMLIFLMMPCVIAESGYENEMSAYYVVQYEDTAEKIAVMYHTEWEKIARMNSIGESQLIPGRILKIPVNGMGTLEHGTYFLSPGVSSLAYAGLHFAVQIHQLKSLNPWVDHADLQRGQLLIIPPRSAVSLLGDPSLLLEDAYLVQQGDDLGRIAGLFSVEESILIRINAPYAEDALHPGLILHLGDRINEEYRNGYMVQKSDTLTRIAERFSVSRDALIALNDLSDPDCLVMGQIMILP